MQGMDSQWLPVICQGMDGICTLQGAGTDDEEGCVDAPGIPG
jgi:hypothetical protein